MNRRRPIAPQPVRSSYADGHAGDEAYRIAFSAWVQLWPRPPVPRPPVYTGGERTWVPYPGHGIGPCLVVALGQRLFAQEVEVEALSGNQTGRRWWIETRFTDPNVAALYYRLAAMTPENPEPWNTPSTSTPAASTRSTVECASPVA